MNNKKGKGMSSSMILTKEVIDSLLVTKTQVIDPKGRTEKHNAKCNGINI